MFDLPLQLVEQDSGFLSLSWCLNREQNKWHSRPLIRSSRVVVQQSSTGKRESLLQNQKDKFLKFVCI